MNIGEAAKKSGLSVKTVRYYDEINLIKPIKNKATNYRHYTTADLAKLQFIGKARRFNFSIKECKELLPRPRPRARVRAGARVRARARPLSFS